MRSFFTSSQGIFAFLSLACVFALASCEAPAPPQNVDDSVCRNLLVPQCASVEISPSIEMACQELYAQKVAYAERCTGPGLYAGLPDEQAFVDSCIGIATAPGVTLTAADIDSCSNQLPTASCLGGGVFPSCVGYQGDLLFPEHDKKGSLTTGSACFANVQCASGYCDHSVVDDCGICKNARNLGESCIESTDVCTEGGCENGICEPGGKKLGEECTTHGIECQVPLYCNEDPVQTLFVCTAKSDVGGPCNAQRPCLDGLGCIDGICKEYAPDGASCAIDGECASYYCKANVCTAKPTGLVEGQDCSVGSCRADLLCPDNHICTAPIYLGDGDACTAINYPTVMCAAGLYCRVVCVKGMCEPSGTCAHMPLPGEHCNRYSQCAHGAHCVGFDPLDINKGVCEKLGTEGEACPCAEQLVCVDEVCRAYGACQ
ncbi:MAG TPA: hypothetical protein PK156_22375 [Polyangium sp.]|nr:hypothetical protein [Polyangium sp.]